MPCNPVFVGPNTLFLAHSHDGSVGSGCYSLELLTLHLSLALKDEGWSKGSSKPPGSNGAFWNFQQLTQFLSSLVLLRAALLAGSRLWNVHISKQMAPGAHNCCQTCVDFNSPFSLALCEITCLCVVTQLNCQLWWLSLAFTTTSGNHQYYLRGWTKEEKNHSGGAGEYFGVSEWSSIFLWVEQNLSRAVISNLHLRQCHLPNHCFLSSKSSWCPSRSPEMLTLAN